MNMKNFLRVTRKGQTTLPAAIRSQLGIGHEGGALQYSFDADSGQLIVSKVTTVADISEQTSRHIKPGIKPLLEANKFYQSNRKRA
jgi:bifunctional DNA-binding transcriptional regulator/antitoxin component of YhaV-PrlF toxin-antitoxin module